MIMVANYQYYIKIITYIYRSSNNRVMSHESMNFRGPIAEDPVYRAPILSHTNLTIIISYKRPEQTIHIHIQHAETIRISASLDSGWTQGAKLIVLPCTLFSFQVPEEDFSPPKCLQQNPILIK
jgi:hypothetical protein